MLNIIEIIFGNRDQTCALLQKVLVPVRREEV